MLVSNEIVKQSDEAIASAADISSFIGPNEVGVELLNGLSESIFGGVAQAMVDLGWSVFPQDRYDGRKPGIVHGRTIRWKEDYDLPNRLPSQTDLDTWIRHCASHNVAVAFGPASGSTFAIDIDVLDADRADRIVDIAFEVFGETPFMRVGRAPKIALIYRHSADDVVKYVSRRLADENGNASEHAVEIIASGRPFTFHGRHHKTGGYFQWIGSATPLIHGPEKAPVVTSEQVESFLSRVDAELGFVKSSASAAAISWTEGDEGDVRSAIVETGSSGKISDGRHEYLNRLVWATCCANSQEICVARERGDDTLRPLLAGVGLAVFDEFISKAESTGRWEPKNLRKEISSRVSSAAQKVQPPRPKMMSTRPNRATIDEISSDLPVIEIEAGEIERVVNEAEQALIKSGRGLYQRGGEIVALGETPVITASGRQISTQRIYSVGEHGLLENLSASAIWMKYDARAKGQVRTSPPMWVAQTMADRRGRLRLPVLSGVIGAPTMRPDGSILSAEGYDEATGLILDANGVQFPKVPEDPTRDDALEALWKLKALITDFPFVSNADRSVALSLMLTGCIRRSLRTSPLHGFSAPTAGTGKSKLVDIASILSTGREAGVLAQGRSDEETEKRLASSLIAGDPVITLDNCTLPVDGDLLCQMLTQVSVRPRILGRSEAPEIASSALMTATGNNLVIGGDMTRRSILCSLDAGVERPENRVFSSDVLEETRRRRGELVVAALTVLKAYKAAGSPKQKSPLGSFEEWSRTVRDALVWLGEADPCETMEKMRELDPKLDALSSVLSAWNADVGGIRVSTSELIERAFKQTHTDEGSFVFQHPRLRAALMAVIGSGGSGIIHPRALGRWLGANANRRVGGSRIVRLGLIDGSPTWRLETETDSIPF